MKFAGILGRSRIKSHNYKRANFNNPPRKQLKYRQIIKDCTSIKHPIDILFLDPYKYISCRSF